MDRATALRITGNDRRDVAGESRPNLALCVHEESATGTVATFSPERLAGLAMAGLSLRVAVVAGQVVITAISG